MHSLKRRSALKHAGVVLGMGLGGCLGAGSEQPDDGTESEETHSDVVSPEKEPETVPGALHCDDGTFERHFPGYGDDSIHWGDFKEFALRADSLSYDYGDTANITLRNTASETRETGNKNKYNFEVYTEAGWQDVRGWADGNSRPYTDEAVSHDAGGGFEWDITLTENGIPDATTHDEILDVCPDLESARYRFIYWGLGGEEAIGVAFDLQREM